MLELAHNVQRLYGLRRDFVCVTLVQIKGSAPQEEGAKMLVTPEGLYWGTVGGGKIEAHSIRYARELLNGDKPSHLQQWNLQKDIGMSCGGGVTLFFDVNRPMNWNLAVFGAGHVAQELCRILSTWNCHVSVFDDRAEWLERMANSLNISKVLSPSLADEVDKLPEGTYVLSLTKGHAADVPILQAALRREGSFPFIGVIGSDVKAKRIKAELAALGTPPASLEKLVCPIGLPIGNNTPAEIAISISAQLLAVRDRTSFKIEGGFHD